MKRLQVLMPMAGRGKRFAEQGYTTPKCCIEVDGMPMFMKSFSSLERIAGKKTLTIVSLEQHEKEWELTSLIKGFYPSAEVILLPEVTRGPVETCVAARSYLTRNDPLLCLDCDLWFESAQYDAEVQKVLSGTSDISGVVTSFESSLPRYSYAKEESSGRVVLTAEKQVISNRALIGAYFFSSAELFYEAAEDLMEHWSGEGGREPTIAPLYNYLIAQNRKVLLTSVEKFRSFGTPEELKASVTR